MPHKGKILLDHKKRFILSQTSSSPYYGLDVARQQAEIEETFTEAKAGSAGVPSSGGPHDINLTEIPNVERADNFRVGMSRVWLDGNFGIPNGRRVIFGGIIRGASPTLPDFVYKEQSQYGYGLSVLKTKTTLNLLGTAPNVTVPTGRAALDDIFMLSSEGQFYPPLGHVSKTDSNSLSITGSLRTKQEFFIAPASSFGEIVDVQPTRGIDPPTWWTEPRKWVEHVSGNIVGTFEDFTFNMWQPFSLDKIDQGYAGAAHIRDIYVDIKPSYNFHIPAYEDIISDISSSLLPNIYVFESELDEFFKDESDSRFKQHLELGGFIPPKKIFVDIKNKKGEKIGEKDNGQYFEIWAKAAANADFANLPSNSSLSGLSYKYENLIFPMENLNLLEKVKGKERLFPMNIKIDFSTDTSAKFADALQDSKLFSALIAAMIGSKSWFDQDISQPHWSGRSKWATWNWKEWSSIPIAYNPSLPHSSLQWDLGKWLDDYVIGDGGLMNKIFLLIMWLSTKKVPAGLFSKGAWTNFVFLGTYEKEILAAAKPEFRLFLKLMMESFKNELSKIVDTEFRTFQEILQGKYAYSETLLYKVTRFRLSGTKWVSEQNIWLPNSSESDVLSYIDTQVKYDVPYRYVINAYQLVIGNKYEYAINEINPQPDSLYAKLCLFNEPSIKLIEVPYYDSEIDHPEGIKVLDKPPIRPDVNVIPYKGAYNKVLLWLNGNVGDYWQPDIRIFPDELSERDKMKKRVVDGEEEINFKSDDAASNFEIFRINKKPRKYSDFAVVGTPIFVSSRGAGSAAYIDKTIRPNRKYYYTFRTIDSHGHTSNPSCVYEVELVKDGENVYPLINTIDMGLPPERQITKKGRKFIEIKPSFLQTTLNEKELARLGSSPTPPGMTTTQIAGQVQLRGATNLLGVGSPSVWWTGHDNQKKFKIRLNSKSSGKKLDINLRFKIVATSDATEIVPAGGTTKWGATAEKASTITPSTPVGDIGGRGGSGVGGGY